MLYDLSNPLQLESFKVKSEALKKKGCIVELTEKKPQRSLQANKYLHVILSYFALEIGETMEWVKQKYYKALVNQELYVREKDDKYLGKVKYLRSSADLDSAEFALSIDRFRNFASQEAGIYLPSPNEHAFLQQIEIEISRHKQYL